MRLSKRGLGIAIGVVWGLSVMLVTWVLLLRGADGQVISELSDFYIGYSFSFGGSIIGLIWGFVDGFIGGFLIALIYNIVIKHYYKTKTPWGNQF